MKTSFDFLSALADNNTREWFSANRKWYDEAVKEFKTLVQQVLIEMQKADESLIGLQLKDTLFRINRDTRFSKNKDPYKNNFGAVLSPGGKKSGKACYYLHLSPEESFVASGVWMPEPPILKAIRQEIYFNGRSLEKILNSKKFKEIYPEMEPNEKLKKLPKDFEGPTPYEEWIKFKSFIISQPLSSDELLSSELPSLVIDRFKTALPFVHWLNNAIDENQ